MTVILALIRKNLLDARWVLVAIASTLFGLCWLLVFATHRIEVRGRVPEGVPTIQIEMNLWNNNPFILLLVGLWAISRGSAAVAGEIEKGSMDLVMSRPVRRSSFLIAQVVVAAVGLSLIGGAMVAGNLVGAHYNSLRSPPSAFTLSKPTLNLAAFGWAVYGYSLLLSSFDLVRWRPIMIASAVTLASYIAHVVANIPPLRDEWGWIDNFSMFKACNVVEVATKGETLAFNAGLLGAIGASGIALGFVAFARRDLPAGS